MVRENRLLISEQGNKVALEKYKIEPEILKLQHDLGLSGIAIPPPPFMENQRMDVDLNSSADSCDPYLSVEAPQV